MSKNKHFWETPPVVIMSCLRHGSIYFALISLVLLGVAFSLSSEQAKELSTLWQPTLMVLWLAASSRLIDMAFAQAKRFERKASKLLPEKIENQLLRNHEEWLVARQAILTGIAFAALGVSIIYFVDVSWYWKLSWVFVIGATFYYAGYGIWGAWVVTEAVKELSNEVLNNDALNAFHGDKYCGLGFALRYSDMATLFMLTGVTALPMAVMLVEKSLEMNIVKGSVITGLIVLALIIWGSFAFVSSVSGRSAIAHALTGHRDKLLDEIAMEKKHLLEEGRDKERLELLNAQEEAVLKIKTGLFSGAGAWKDLFSSGAAGLAIANIIQEVQKAYALINSP